MTAAYLAFMKPSGLYARLERAANIICDAVKAGFARLGGKYVSPMLTAGIGIFGLGWLAGGIGPCSEGGFLGFLGLICICGGGLGIIAGLVLSLIRIFKIKRSAKLSP